MTKMLQDNIVSPRTYQNKKQELEKWLLKETKDLKKTELAIEKGWNKAL